MVKKARQMMAIMLAAVMVILLVPSEAFAANSHENQVHIIVENNTWMTSNGAAWDGTLVDAWVDIDADNPTALQALKTAVGGAAYVDVVSGGYGDYIAAIKNDSKDWVRNGQNGTNYSAGWLFSVNGAYASVGITSYASIQSGDEFTFSYSLNGGEDLGQKWDITKNKLKSLVVSEGVLSPAFTPDTTEYTLTIPAGTNGVIVTPELENPACTMEIKSGKVSYNRNTEIPVTNGTKISIENTIRVYNFETSSNEEATSSYTIYVKKASDVSVDTMLRDATTMYTGTADTYKYGNEWVVLSLARAGELSKEGKEAYYQDLEREVTALKSAKLDSTQATTNERVVLALSAIGKNPEKVAGYNLLEPLADMSYITAQGQNAAIYALLAFDSKQYTIPTAPEGTTQTTRDGLIEYLLSKELANGGWDWSSANADADLTAMAIQALTPYYTTKPEVKAAVDRALAVLSAMQNPDGSYASWGTTNSNSTAQVVLALTGMNIDPSTESRFVKNGYSVLGSLGDFYIPNGGFKYIVSDTAENGYATMQVYEALIACQRFANQKNAFFDMRDVNMEQPTKEEASTTETTTTTETTATGNSNENKNGQLAQDNQQSTSISESKGTVLTVTSSKCKVVVTSANDNNPSVEYKGTTNKETTKITIPDTVTVGGITYKVTSIADNVFADNKKITKVTVGKNVTAIGKDAFKNCTKLKKVEIKSTTLNKIGSRAFYGAKKLTRITLKTIKITKESIDKNALKGTNKKLVIKVPKSKVKKYKVYFKNKGNKTVKVKK